MNPVLYFVHGQVPRHKNRRTLSIIGGSENVDGRVPKNVSAKQRTLVERPPAGPGWLHQIKFDGIGSSRARTAAACAYGRAPRPITRAVSAASERRWRRCPGRTKPPFAALQRAAESAGEMNVGTIGVAAPNPASSRTAYTPVSRGVRRPPVNLLERREIGAMVE